MSDWATRDPFFNTVVDLKELASWLVFLFAVILIFCSVLRSMRRFSEVLRNKNDRLCKDGKEHEWEQYMKIRLISIKNGESSYSHCKKCGLLRHDNDGETFTTDLDFHTEKRKGLKNK
jgi:hypothetical protein